MRDPSQECLETRRQVDLKTSYKKEVQEDHKTAATKHKTTMEGKELANEHLPCHLRHQ